MTQSSRGSGKRRNYPFKRNLKRKVRRIVYALAIAALAGGVSYFQKNYTPSDQRTESSSAPTSQSLERSAPKQDNASIQKSNPADLLDKLRRAADQPGSQFWLSINGKVIKLLKDDLKGSRHQKFLIRVAPDITLLISHNIDLAERVPIRKNDWVSIRGRYEWNNRGGVIHWTHHDPKGRKQGGWIRHAGREYR